MGLAVAGLVVTNAPVKATEISPGDIKQPETADDESLILRAFELRQQALNSGDQPYGALVVREGRVVGEAPSRVMRNHDATAHAEMEAIRDASRRLQSSSLQGCILYSSSPPCPMCEAAAYWAGIERMVSGNPPRDRGRPNLC